MTRPDPSRRVLAAGAILALLATGACSRIDVNDGLEVSSGYNAGLVPDAPAGSVAITDSNAPTGASLDFDPGEPEVIDSTLDTLRTEAALQQGETTSADGAAPQPLPEPTFTPAPLADEEAASAEAQDELIIAIGSYHADIPPNSALNIRDEPGGETLGQLPWNMTVKTTGNGVRIDETVWAHIKPVGDADWTEGWVVFDLLSFGRPAPTPTPDEVVVTEPTATTEPTAAPDPTPTPEGDDSDDDDQDDDDQDPDATPTPSPTPEPTPETFDAPVTEAYLVQFDLTDTAGAHVRTSPGGGDLVGKLPPGTTVTIVSGTGFRIDGVGWVQVSGDDLQGWIAVTDLQVI